MTLWLDKSFRGLKNRAMQLSEILRVTHYSDFDSSNSTFATAIVQDDAFALLITPITQRYVLRNANVGVSLNAFILQDVRFALLKLSLHASCVLRGTF